MDPWSRLSRLLSEPGFWLCETCMVSLLEIFVRPKVTMLIYIPFFMLVVTSGIAGFSWLLERRLRPVRRLKFLNPEMKRCLKVIEGDTYYETIEAIESLSPLLTAKELDIEIPPLYNGRGISAFRGSVRFWRDFLERLIILTEGDVTLETLREARKICKELLKSPSADKEPPSTPTFPWLKK